MKNDSSFLTTIRSIWIEEENIELLDMLSSLSIKRTPAWFEREYSFKAETKNQLSLRLNLLSYLSDNEGGIEKWKDEHKLEIERNVKGRPSEWIESTKKMFLICHDRLCYKRRKGPPLPEGESRGWSSADRFPFPLVVGKEEVNGILEKAHSGHKGESAMKKELVGYYWKGQDIDVKWFIHRCVDCQREKPNFVSIRFFLFFVWFSHLLYVRPLLLVLQF